MPQKYRCSNCNYAFVPKKAKPPLACPYCGRTGTLGTIKLVQEFIDEAVEKEQHKASFER